jgi:hypothetical protein
MTFDWDTFLARLKSYPSNAHRLLPPCPGKRIAAVESELGELPKSLKEMLNHVNGAKLFIRAGPMVSVFGISVVPPLPPMEWASDWWIDKFTPWWRDAESGRQNDWVIAMMNYGGLILIDANNKVSEWDTSEGRWLKENVPFADWMKQIIAEGESFLTAS